MLRRVLEETIRIQNQRGLDDRTNLTNLVDTESTLQTLAMKGEDLTVFSALESESDNDTNDDWIFKFNYCCSHNTPEEPEEEVLE